MNISEYNFRYMHLRFFNIKKDNKEYLALAYINHEEGIKFEILANISNNEFSKLNTTRQILDYNEVKTFDITAYKYEQVDEKKYSERINEILKEISVSDEIKQTREFDNFDNCRSQVNPDEVEVVLYDGINTPETIWVRCKKVLDTKIRSIAIADSSSSFNIKKNDYIDFQVGNSKGKTICIAKI